MKISLEVPDVPSNFMTPLTFPPDCWKLRPGVFASLVLCSVITEFVSFRCKSVSGALTDPIPTCPPAFNNMSPVPLFSMVMSPFAPSTISIDPESVSPFVDSNKLNAPLDDMCPTSEPPPTLTKSVSSIMFPVPAADNSKLAFDADVAILLSVIVTPSSIFKVPNTFAPVYVTLKRSAKLAPSNT